MTGLINKEDIAELIIYSDAMQEILNRYHFKQTSKFEFNKVNRAVKNIIKTAFGNTELQNLDQWVYELRMFTQDLIKDKVHLKIN